MAETPGLLEASKAVGDLFVNSSFDKDEITVIWQTINVEHDPACGSDALSVTCIQFSCRF